MLVVDRLNFLEVGENRFRTLKREFGVPKLVPLARLVGGERSFFIWVRESSPRILRNPFCILEGLTCTRLPRPSPAFRAFRNDPVTVFAFADHNVFSADDSYAFRADVVDVAKVVRKRPANSPSELQL